MDKTVPAGAALLLAFIYDTETSETPPKCYEVIYAHKQYKLAKPLTKMTLDEVIAAQKGWSRNHGSSAAGAPQLMRNTLLGLIKELSLRGSQILDGNLQDRLGYHLLKRRGYEEFIAGEISRTEFGKRMAQEWASFPLLSATKGRHRTVKRGETYYAGDGLNKALVAPEVVEAVLDRVKAVATSPAQPNPKPEPIPQPEPVIVEKPVVKDPEQLDKPLTGSKTIWTYITVIFTAIGGILESLDFINLDWRVQIFMLCVLIGLALYGIKRRRHIARVYREFKAEFGGA